MLSRVAVLVAAVSVIVPFGAASAEASKIVPQSHGKPKANGAKDQGDQGECPRGNLCVWTGPKFTGTRTVFADQADLGGRCRAMHSPIGSVANRTGHSPFPLHLFLFRGNYPTPCDVAGVYAQYVPGQMDAAVPDGPVSGVRIYADPQTAGADGGHQGSKPAKPAHHGRHHR